MKKYNSITSELFSLPIKKRLFKGVIVNDGCWSWRGNHNKAGYGRMGIGPRKHGKLYLVHRLVWSFINGPLDDQDEILHSCDNPGCPNPSHIWKGTQADNMADASRKGRLPGNPNPCSERNKEKFRALYAGRIGVKHSAETKLKLRLLALKRPLRERNTCGQWL